MLDHYFMSSFYFFSCESRYLVLTLSSTIHLPRATKLWSWYLDHRIRHNQLSAYSSSWSYRDTPAPAFLLNTADNLVVKYTTMVDVQTVSWGTEFHDSNCVGNMEFEPCDWYVVYLYLYVVLILCPMFIGIATNFEALAALQDRFGESSDNIKSCRFGACSIVIKFNLNPYSRFKVHMLGV